MLTIRQLRYLDALARCQHFGRAAEECAVSQPALSMQIRELEEFLGIELFERRPGAPILTGVGIEIAQRAGAILSATRDLVDLAQHRSKLLTGSLRLGVIPTLAPYLLPHVLPRLQRDHPDLNLDLLETQTKILLAELARGTLDVLLMALPVESPEFKTLHVLTDRFLLAVPANDPLPDNARVTPSDVEERKLILLEEGHCLRDQALDRDRCRVARPPRQAATIFRTATKPQRRTGVAANLAARTRFRESRSNDRQLIECGGHPSRVRRRWPVLTPRLHILLRRAGSTPVYHTVQLLDWATGGPNPFVMQSAESVAQTTQ